MECVDVCKRHLVRHDFPQDDALQQSKADENGRMERRGEERGERREKDRIGEE